MLLLSLSRHWGVGGWVKGFHYDLGSKEVGVGWICLSFIALFILHLLFLVGVLLYHNLVMKESGSSVSSEWSYYGYSLQEVKLAVCIPMRVSPYLAGVDHLH